MMKNSRSNMTGNDYHVSYSDDYDYLISSNRRVSSDNERYTL